MTTVLQCVSCSVVQCLAVSCSVFCSVSQCRAVSCSVLQCLALQFGQYAKCVKKDLDVSKETCKRDLSTLSFMCCSVLHCVAVCCRVLQCVAV